MTGILETLMAAARAEAGLDKGRSEVNATLRRVAAELRPQLAERGVELEAPAAEAEVVAGVESEVIERIVAPRQRGDHRERPRSGRRRPHIDLRA